jgi:ankyrin repeat protein
MNPKRRTGSVGRWSAMLPVISVCWCVGTYAGTPEEALHRLQMMGIEAKPERLVQYAAQGEITTVELLLDAGVPVTAVDPARGVTALHNAAAQGHQRLVEKLIELGAEVNASDWMGATPLTVAAFYCRVPVMQTLLKAGADVNVQPKKGPTALIAAIYGGNVQAVDLLLQAGANPELKAAYGNTPAEAARSAGRTEILAHVQAAQARMAKR